MDQYQQDFKKADNLHQELVDSLKDRAESITKGQSVGRVDYKLKSGIESIKQEMKHLEKLSYLYSNNDPKYSNVSQKEKQKRMAAVSQLKTKSDRTVQEIQTTFGLISSISGQKNVNLLDLESQRDKDGEFSSTRGLDDKQLLKQQKDLVSGQDEHLDVLGGIISNIKLENQNFSVEVNQQNKMLDSLQVDMDDAHTKMLKVDNKLKNIVASTSSCKLWMIIIIEILVLMFVLIIM